MQAPDKKIKYIDQATKGDKYDNLTIRHAEMQAPDT